MMCAPDTNWQPGEPSNNVRTGDGASGEDAVTITFVGDFNGKWNDIHDIGYNRKTGASVAFLLCQGLPELTCCA